MSERLEEIKKAYNKWSNQYSTASFRYAAVYHEGRPTLLRGVIEFLKDNKSKAEVLDYGELILGSEILTPNDAIQAIENIVNGKPIGKIDIEIPGEFDISLEGTSHRGLPVPSHNPWLGNDWPSFIAILRAKTPRMNEPHSPLVKSSLPLIAYPRDAIRDWIGLDAEQRGDMQYGVAIKIPDFRARITKIVIGEESTTVKIEATLPNDSIQLKAGESDGRNFKELEARLDNDIFSIPTPDGIPYSIHIFLLDSVVDEVLDWQSIYASRAELPRNITFKVPGQQLIHIIEHGENEIVEFKQEVGDGETLAQSVVAFANSLGGDIFVGIDDNGTVIGVRNSAKEVLRIGDILESLCDPTPEFNINTITHLEKEVIIVNVPQGQNPPYFHRGRGIPYVRKGGTDRPSKRGDMDAFYRRDDSLSFYR